MKGSLEPLSLRPDPWKKNIKALRHVGGEEQEKYDIIFILSTHFKRKPPDSKSKMGRIMG